MNDGSIRRLSISQGPLGPIQPCAVEIRPFTVLVGKQGTGKSLLSQILYFFENLPYLAAYYGAALTRGANMPRPPTAGLLLSHALNNLRSSGQPLSTFVDEATRLSWEPGNGDHRLSLSLLRQRGTLLGKPLRRVRYRLDAALRALVTRARTAPLPRHEAIFIPAERVLYSQASGPTTFQLLSLPSTLLFFADLLQLAAKTVSTWDGGEPDTDEARWIARLAETALAGRATYRNDVWRWNVQRGKRALRFRIDMASSGQRANWPLVVLSQVLFSWRKTGQVAPPTTIYVEEPEIHLHPEAQVAMVKLLAFLVNHGFRVVVTTHSLTVLYALNNLVLASSLGRAPHERIPEPEARLSPGAVAAYALEPDGTVHDIVDRETGFLSEVELGQVAARGRTGTTTMIVFETGPTSWLWPPGKTTSCAAPRSPCGRLRPASCRPGRWCAARRSTSC
jgi:hypothetical protein